MYSLRKAAGLTQAQVARLAGVSDKTVSKWENGNARPAAEALQKLEDRGLVKIQDGVGTFVTFVTQSDVRNAYEIRNAVEKIFRI